jgi:hypothetical protein
VKAALAAAAVLAIATTARADDDKPEYQHMTFAEVGDQLTVTLERPNGIGKLFSPADLGRLSAGLPTTVVIRVWITRRDSTDVVTEQLFVRSSVFDVWDEYYTLVLDQKARRTTTTVKLRTEALKWLTRIEDVPIARLDVLPINDVFVLQMLVELNPVSNEELAEVRRRLSQGNGGGIDRGGALFGSFVSVFYNPKIASEDRVLRIHSQPFFRPPL